jgi:CRISPR/Cas system-associated exonuclease Cas4 (RecB family)
MNRGVMSQAEEEKYLHSGKEALEIYLKDLINRGVSPTDMVEVNFANEGVYIDGVHATGKIDKMSFDGNRIEVTDLKTGKSFDGWDSKTNQNDLSEYDKIKLHFFKYQLAYYVLLIRNSRTYNNYSVEKGYIEFIEPNKIGKINILSLSITDELVDRVSRLANIVYSKIMNLDFPNTDEYKMDARGEEKEVKLKDIEDFEDKLLNGIV